MASMALVWFKPWPSRCKICEYPLSSGGTSIRILKGAREKFLFFCWTFSSRRMTVYLLHVSGPPPGPLSPCQLAKFQRILQSTLKNIGGHTYRLCCFRHTYRPCYFSKFLGNFAIFFQFPYFCVFIKDLIGHWFKAQWYMSVSSCKEG